MCQALCIGASLQWWAGQIPALIFWAHQVELKLAYGAVALILSRLQELTGSFFEESHKCPALHLQIEAVGPDVIYQL